jgi:hypothetical protein
MTVSSELLPDFYDHYVVLILDNEVTVENFVTAPPLPWIRLTLDGGAYRVSAGYPELLTAEQAKRETEIREYEAEGYRTFLPRGDLASHALEVARLQNRRPALAFINTIQHNESNYHDP